MNRLRDPLLTSIDEAFHRTRRFVREHSHRPNHELRVAAFGQLEALRRSIGIGTIEAVPYHTIPFAQLNTVTDHGIIALFEALQWLAEWRLGNPDRSDGIREIHEAFDRASSLAWNGTIFPAGNVSPAARREILLSDDRLNNARCAWKVFVRKGDILVEGHGESFVLDRPMTVTLNPNSNIWTVVRD